MGGLVAGGLGGFRFVAHSRYRPGLAVWVVGCRRRRTTLRFTFTSSFHRPFSEQKFVVHCRYLIHTLLLVCPPSVLRVCHAVDARCNLSPPADSTTPARARRRSDLQLARDLQLQPPLTQVNRGNPAYCTPRGTPLPLAASTNPHERLSRREECASAHRSLAPESTRPIGRPLRITLEHHHARLQHERSRRPDVVAGTREHGYYGNHEWQPGGSLQHFQH